MSVVVINVDNAALWRGFLSDLVRVVYGGKPGPYVEELTDPCLAD
jgi:hypothetical protein